MSTPPRAASADERARIIDYTRSLDCIHCGLCLHVCPTYQLTGREASSPRGRVHLMRAVAEGRLEPDDAFAEEMDFCLVCRHCESACPAGVEIGAMMEITRDGLARTRRTGSLARLARWLGLRVVLPSRARLRFAVGLLGLAQRLGLVRLLALLTGARGRALAAMPRVPPRRERRPLPPVTLPDETAAKGGSGEAAAVLAGCVMPELLGRTNRATVAALAAAGVESRTAPGHVCCGALHAHNGDLDHARRLARGTISAFDGLTGADGRPLPVVVNSAGCGAHMKEYERILAEDPDWRERARDFGARVVDFAEYLAAPPRSEALARALAATASGAATPSGVAPRDTVATPVTYDDPCHLCHGQGVRAEPRRVLDLVPGLERVELEDAERCCGSAGVYSLLRPADSAAILDDKLRALERSGARTLITANPGCQLQWTSGIARAGLGVEVLHLAEVLERALAQPHA